MSYLWQIPMKLRPQSFFATGGGYPVGRTWGSSPVGSFCLQGEVAGRKGLHQIVFWLESEAGRSTTGKWKGLKMRSEDRAL